MKLDLSKLVLSGNVPVGFRELTAEETRKPGDIYVDNYTGVWREVKDSLWTSPYGKKNAAGKSENGWLPHFRRIENPPGIPATHGQVTAGACLPADLQYMLDTKTVHTLLAGGVSATNFIGCDIYRLQPAFVVEKVIQRGVACYRGVTIPPGFRELDQDEYRHPGTDAIWLPSCCKDQPPHIWDFNPSYSGPYNRNCNPTIRRTEPVSDKFPLLPGEKVENVTQAIAKELFCSTASIDYKSALEKATAEIAEQDKLIGSLTSQVNRERAAAEVWVKKLREAETELTAQKAANGILKATDQQRSEAIDRIEASCNIRVNNLWIANANLQKKIGDQKYALDRLEQSNRNLCDHKHNLEVKLKDSEAIAEQRRLRVADLECSLLKIKQEVANAKLNEPAPAQPFARNPFAYREIYDNDLLKDGDELTEDGLAWRTFYCGPKARATFGDFRNHYPKLFRARRKL